MLEPFYKGLKRANSILKFIGLAVDVEDNNKNFIQRFLNHPIYIAHLISFNSEVYMEFLWIWDAFRTGKSSLETIFFLPCITFSLVSNFKAFVFLYFSHYINNLVVVMEALQARIVETGEERNRFEKNLMDDHVSMLINISNRTVCLIVIGLLMFATGPLVIMLQGYYATGEVQFELPFVGYYPFNEFDIRVYPWIYIHQLWAATEAVFLVYGPDNFFFTCCTFTNVQFLLLQYDMEMLIGDESHGFDKANFKKLAFRHIELMRCVDLMEEIFSISILVNCVTSSIMICVTGFNVLVGDNIVHMASFFAFLIFGMMQIFLYCYYGDSIMRSSFQLSEAIYNSCWYNMNAADKKDIYFVMMRAQKPCRLTAYGFFNVDLNAFTSILSTSWSYFALLKTMYHSE